MRIAIIDYGLGNLRSVENAFQHLGAEAALTESPADVAAAKAVVLPGVGAFGDGMAGLNQRGLTQALKEAHAAGKPGLGICLGLQLFFESSEESPGAVGLGLFKGTVKKFQGAPYSGPNALKVPHMGWNTLAFNGPQPLFAGLADGEFVYFVHSYYVAPTNPEWVLASSDYGMKFCAAAGTGNLMGCQFHPEKSQRAGLKILSNFIKMVG